MKKTKTKENKIEIDFFGILKGIGKFKKEDKLDIN